MLNSGQKAWGARLEAFRLVVIFTPICLEQLFEMHASRSFRKGMTEAGKGESYGPRLAI